MTQSDFRVGDTVFLGGMHHTCGEVLRVNSTIDVLLVAWEKGGQTSISVNHPGLRLATEADKQGLTPPTYSLNKAEIWAANPSNWQPASPPEPEPEPVANPEESTLPKLEEAITDWAEMVDYFASGRFCEDEYTHDVMYRQSVHALLNGFQRLNLSVPDYLRRRLDAADQHFMDISAACACVWGHGEYDPVAFWYYYRYPVR